MKRTNENIYIVHMCVGGGGWGVGGWEVYIFLHGALSDGLGNNMNPQ